jgi:hypothetical protein
VDTVNVGFRVPACPPFYCCAVREEVHCHIRQSTPDQDVNRISFQSGDHIPNCHNSCRTACRSWGDGVLIIQYDDGDLMSGAVSDVAFLCP